MPFQGFVDPQFDRTGVPIEVGGEGWIAQTVFWSRAVAGVFLLAGGAVLLTADWNSLGIPPEVWLALIWGGPSVIYFAASFAVRKFRGNICRGIGLLAIVHAMAIYGGAIWLGTDEEMPMFLFLATLLVGGLANLAVSAFWAQRAIRHPVSSDDPRRGFSIAPATQGQSIRSDLGK